MSRIDDIALLAARIGRRPGAYSTPALRTVGVDTYSHRYHGSTLRGMSGSPVVAWPDSGPGGAALTATIGTGGTALVDTTTYPSATLHLAELANGITEALPYTFALVAKVPAPQGNVVTMRGARLERIGSGDFRLGPFGTGGAGSTFTIAGSSNWVVFVATVDTAAQTLAAAGASAAGTFTPGSTSATKLGGVPAGADWSIAEFITWPTLLDATQRATVDASLRSAYSL